MEYTVEALMKRLNAGESADAIADEMAKMLTAANEEVRRAEAAAKANEEAKRNDMEKLLLTIADYLQTYYPVLCADATKDLTAEDKAELLEVLRDAVIDALEKTQNMTSVRPKMDPMTAMVMDAMFNAAAPSKKGHIHTQTDDEVLNDFLSKICQ